MAYEWMQPGVKARMTAKFSSCEKGQQVTIDKPPGENGVATVTVGTERRFVPASFLEPVERTAMATAEAHHDLNGVKVLTISGWPGSHQVRPLTDGGTGVTIKAPRRAEGEFWTFSRTRVDGILSCHSSLVGSPTLVSRGGDQTLTVYLPAEKIDTIDVRLI